MNGRSVGSAGTRTRNVGVPRGYGSHARPMPVTSSRLADADQVWRVQHRRELARRYSEIMDDEPDGAASPDPVREAQLAQAAQKTRDTITVPPLRPQYFSTAEHISLGDLWRRILDGKTLSRNEARDASHVLFHAPNLDLDRRDVPLPIEGLYPPFSTQPGWRPMLEDELGRLTSANFSDRELPVGRSSLRYGEIAALAGDFYDKPEALEKDLSDGVKANLRGLTPRGIGGWLYSKLLAAKAAVRQLGIAVHNEGHFSPGSWAVYARYHLEALRLALERDFDHALARDAFAAHFLSDAFATGHVRTPRIVLGENWLRLGLVHAIDMHKEDNEHGLWVGNRAGFVWRAYGDDKLDKNPVHQAMVAIAIARSVRRLQYAFKLEGQRAIDLRNLIDSAYAGLPKQPNPRERIDPAHLTILGRCGLEGFPNVREWLPVDLPYRDTPGGRESLANYPPKFSEAGLPRHAQPRFDEYFLPGATAG